MKSSAECPGGRGGQQSTRFKPGPIHCDCDMRLHILDFEYCNIECFVFFSILRVHYKKNVIFRTLRTVQAVLLLAFTHLVIHITAIFIKNSYNFSKFKFNHFSSIFKVHFQAFPAPAAVINYICSYSIYSIPIISLLHYI